MNNSRFSGDSGGAGRAGDQEPCATCGGDGRIENAWGQRATCPSCHGNGRRVVTTGFRDVTKTKEEHHRPTNRAGAVVKQTWPTSASGMALATQIKESTKLSDATKERLTREIIDHESKHPQPTKTFLRRLRKENGLLVPAA